MTDPADDQARLRGYVEVWWQAVDDFTALLEELPAERVGDADRPAGLGRARRGRAHRAPRGGARRRAGGDRRGRRARPRRRGLMGLYTEQGVVARRDRDARRAHQRDPRRRPPRRHTALLADPPTDGTRRARRGSSAASPWTWKTLLRNRPLDVWMHEQDVRRAVGRPGGLDAARGGAHRRLPRREPRLRARPSGSARRPAPRWCWRSPGSAPAAFGVDEAGRGERLAEVPADPTVGLAHGPRDVRAAGRRPSRPPSRRGPRRRRPGARRSGCSAGRGRPVSRAVTPVEPVATDAWRPRRHPRPGRPHRARHRHHRRRARPPHRARAGPRAAPGSCWPGARRARLAETPRRDPPRGAAAPRWSGWWSTSPTSASVRRAAGRAPRRSGRSTCWSTTPA